MGLGRWGRIQGMGCAQAFAPLREGGAARRKDRQRDCASAANGKGGGAAGRPPPSGKARAEGAPRVSRCLPPRLLLDGNWQDKHAQIKGIP